MWPISTSTRTQSDIPISIFHQPRLFYFQRIVNMINTTRLFVLMVGVLLGYDTSPWLSKIECLFSGMNLTNLSSASANDSDLNDCFQPYPFNSGALCPNVVGCTAKCTVTRTTTLAASVTSCPTAVRTYHRAAATCMPYCPQGCNTVVTVVKETARAVAIWASPCMFELSASFESNLFSIMSI
jgi:hypothetical protein